jgi:16S rRNA G1207 methylase RsmC
MIDDVVFKRSCAKWHIHFSRCMDRMMVKEASSLRGSIEDYLRRWQSHLLNIRKKRAQAEAQFIELRDSEASALRRLRLLESMANSMDNSIKRFGSDKKRMEKRHEMTEISLVEKMESGGNNEPQ